MLKVRSRGFPDPVMDAYAGIDVAFAKGKVLPISVCVMREGRLEPLELRSKVPTRPPRGQGNPNALDPVVVEAFADETARYLRSVESTFDVSIQRLAIDAPSDPKRRGERRRAAEAALDARGISCITTPSEDEFLRIREKARRHLDDGGAPAHLPHANQLWMLVGFELFRRLRRQWRCLEVFPQATVSIIGAGERHKSQAVAALFQLAAAARHTRWPLEPSKDSMKVVGYGALHDRIDAYLAAWVASLEVEERLALGTPLDDVIWVPKCAEKKVSAPLKTS